MNVKKFFLCSNCNSEYEDDYDAINCCDVSYIFRCGGCDKSHNFIENAEKCCSHNENEKLKEQLKLG
jgi:hypothetical protein